jgi:tripartite-type tricarboxylate transporter receptor subunit TctC
MTSFSEQRSSRRFSLSTAVGVACAVVFSAGLMRTTPAVAQAYPDHPVRLIVPFTAGGATDVTARRLADFMSQKLGQQFIVENVVGVGGAVGARMVAKSAPDGYTLLYGTTSVYAINPALYTNLGYDPLKDFALIARTFDSDMMLVAHPSTHAKTIAELVDYSKKNPGKLNFGSAGIGTPMHVTGEMLKLLTGMQMVHVPYKGGAQSVQDVAAGHIQVLFENPLSLIPLVRAGQLNALGVTGEQRNAQAPEVPTMKEAGVDIVVALIFGMAAPAGTPKPIIDKLNATVNEGLRSTELLQSVASFGAVPKPGTPESFTKFIEAELKRWKQVAVAANIKVE